MQEIVMGSLTVALVIVSSTLLTASNYAIKNDYKIKTTKRLLLMLLQIYVRRSMGAVLLMGVFQERLSLNNLA